MGEPFERVRVKERHNLTSYLLFNRMASTFKMGRLRKRNVNDTIQYDMPVLVLEHVVV